jgi:hypothetical protein
MNKGWSIKQMHRLMMTSEAYQMASEYNDAVQREERSRRHLPVEVPHSETRRRDRPRQHHGRCRLYRLDDGRPAIFPHVDESFIKTLFRGIYRNQDDAPDVWRRSIYIYAKRTLPNPMLHAFDLADMSQSFGARYTSTVPTQALQLLNDDFVLNQAQLFAERLKKKRAGRRQANRSGLPDRADAAPTAKELSMATDMIGEGFSCGLHERHAQSQRISIYEVIEMKNIWNRRDFLFSVRWRHRGLALAQMLHDQKPACELPDGAARCLSTGPSRREPPCAKGSAFQTSRESRHLDLQYRRGQPDGDL